jgi:hypothetical protein
VYHQDQLIYHKAHGYRDVDQKQLLEKNSIYRMASQTKLITTVGIMMLLERGKFLLNDPISKFLPEFKNPLVLDSYNELDTTFTTIPASREITFKDLLTHTSGIGYPQIGSPQMTAIYYKSGVYGGLGLVNETTLSNQMRLLAKTPLFNQPGEKYTYGLNIDLLGYLIEVISGQSLWDFYQKEIFEPLGMKDTWFFLPEDKYYGFSLNKDHLYLTDDFTIHHNTGKSTALAKVCNKYVAMGDTAVIIFQTEKHEAYQVKDFIKTFAYTGVNRLILVMEDVGGVEMEDVRRGADSGLLSLLDNNEKTLKIPTLTIATTNFPETLMGALTNRPGRFDDKIEAGYPKAEARIKLMEFFVKRPLEANEASALKGKVADSLSPAHLKEALIRSVIHEKTLEVALKEVIKDVEKYNKAFKEAGKGLGFNE